MTATLGETGRYLWRGDNPVPARVQVIGERSSGTNYVKRLLGRNDILKPTELLGWKHGFCQAAAIPPDLAVVIVVRDPADWALSMHRKPWHCPPEMQRLAFSDFIRAPWETVIDRARYFPEVEAPDALGRPLQHDRDPLTGRAYPNLFALRRAKLAGHLSFLGRGCTVAVLRLESVTADPAATLSALCEGFGLPAPTGPLRPVVKRLGSRFKPAVEDRPETPAALPDRDRTFLRAELDSTEEAALGYGV